MIRIRSMFLTGILLTQFLLIIAVGSGNSGEVNIEHLVQNTSTEEVPIEFAHSEDFSVELADTTIETTEFNGSEFLDGLTTFVEPGVTAYLENDLIPEYNDSIPISAPLTDLTITIVESYIINDQDGSLLGAGEIFFKIWANGNYTRFPVSGELSANDGDTLTLDLEVFQGWAWNSTLIVEVWESDVDTDDNLGKIIYTNDTLTDTTITLTTDLGHAQVTFQYQVGATKTTITAHELLTGYKPFLYIDDETSGTEEPDAIYGRVCYGYDQVLARNLWALQYFFFWGKETYGTDPLEVDVHKYDYEEVLIFIDPSDSSIPIRIVYDQAQNPVYPDHDLVIFESPSSPGNYSTTVDFMESFHPFLGINLTIDYYVQDTGTLQDQMIPSLLGARTLKLTIDTFYHAFDKGEGSNLVGYNYTVNALTDSIFKDWYSHLNESLHDNIITVPLIDYTTPRISPFTFDPTNPFKRPYLINAWANVMDDLAAFTRAKTQDITIAADLDLTMTLAMAGLLTAEYPSAVESGESYDINYTLDLDQDTLILRIDYEFGLNVSINFWFLGNDLKVFQNGTFELNIPLATINSLLDSIGISPQDITDKVVDKINSYLGILYLEIDEIILSSNLLGNVLDATIRLHIWDIMNDMIPTIVNLLAPQIGPAVELVFWILDQLISFIDLKAVMALDGIVSGDITANQASLNQNSIEFTESGQKTPISFTVAAIPTSSDVQISLGNFAYGVNFYIDWFIEAGLESPFNYYLPDFGIHITRFPNYQAHLPSGLIEANVTTTSLEIPISDYTVPSSTTTTTSKTTTLPTTSEPSIGFEFLSILSILSVLLYKRKINRS